jgi:hypothetical protein
VNGGSNTTNLSGSNYAGEYLAERYPQCLGANKSIDAQLKKTVNYTYTTFETAVLRLKAIENDFNCASYCTDHVSEFRAFSEVSLGPVAHNCTYQINEWVHETSNAVAGAFWTFFGVTIFSAAYILAFACRKEHELNSPLLTHYRQ